MKAYIYINYNNIVVLKDYLEVIKVAIEKMGISCEYISDMKEISKKSLIVYPMGIDAIKYYFKGYHNFIVWQQGATADESFMRNKSRLRRVILNAIDILAMKKAKFVLYVSEYMKKYYERMSHCDFSEKAYVMPCFNERFNEIEMRKKNYEKNIFTYVGSLDLWQCFDKTVDVYKEIEKNIPDSQLKVLTFQVDEAKSILENKGIRNYSVKQVPKEQVKQEIRECTYGFILREDNVVNRVATPTKISSYLSMGVIPIFSECLVDFNSISERYNIGYSVNSRVDIPELIQFILKDKDKKQIINSISLIFDTYYNKDKHADEICKKMLKNIQV